MNIPHGHTQWGIKAFIPPKLPKVDITTDAECVANSVNANEID